MPGSQGVFRQSIQGNALFLFFITREGERGEQGARWLPIGSSYPLDDVYGALPSAAEHTALKEVFFQLQRKSSTSSDPTPFQPPHPTPSPNPAAEPQLLPALLPLAAVQVLHVAQLGQVGGGPLPLSSEDTCFPVGCGCVGVGRVEHMGGGVQFMGWEVEMAPWERRK